MQNIEPNNLKIEMLTDAELDAVNGGNCVGDFFRSIGNAIAGAVEAVGSAIWNGLTGGPTAPWRGPFGNHPI